MLILLRHGHSQAQEEKRMGGQVNYPVTEQGREEIKDAADTLSTYEFDAIFTSDLERCLGTLHGVLHGNPFFKDEQWTDGTITQAQELRERSGGSMEGMEYAEMRKILAPRKYKLWQRDYFEAPPDGESLKDVEDRVLPYLKEYVFPLVNDGKNVLLVAHSGVIRVILGYIKKAEEPDIVKWNIENAIPYFVYNNIDY